MEEVVVVHERLRGERTSACEKDEIFLVTSNALTVGSADSNAVIGVRFRYANALLPVAWEFDSYAIAFEDRAVGG